MQRKGSTEQYEEQKFKTRRSSQNNALVKKNNRFSFICQVGQGCKKKWQNKHKSEDFSLTLSLDSKVG